MIWTISSSLESEHQKTILALGFFLVQSVFLAWNHYPILTPQKEEA